MANPSVSPYASTKSQRRREWAYTPHQRARNAEHLSTCGQHMGADTRAKHVLRDIGGRLDDVFAVVHHQQPFATAKIRSYAFDDGPIASLIESQMSAPKKWRAGANCLAGNESARPVRDVMWVREC